MKNGGVEQPRMAAVDFHPSVPVFDANLRVGNPRDAYSEQWSRENVLQEMQRHGIGKALVFHAHSESISPLVGQELLDEWIAGDARFVGMPCVLPTDDCMRLLDSLFDRNRLPCVRLGTVLTQILPFTETYYGALLKWLEQHGVPLCIPIHAVDLRDVAATLIAHPRLQTLLIGTHYTHHLWIRPLMRAVPTLHVELSRYEVFAQVETLAEEFGWERMVYGSGYPDYAIGPVLYYLHHCRCSREELSLACGGNLERLIRLPRK